MPKLTPVDFDPFADDVAEPLAPPSSAMPVEPVAQPAPRLTPVDFNPFPEDPLTDSEAAVRARLDAVSAKVDAKKKRTWGEAGMDTLYSLGEGANATVGMLADVYGLATGDMDNALKRQTESGAEYYRERLSPQLRARVEERKKKVDAAEGEWAKLGTVMWETLKDPSLLAYEVTKQAPNFVVGGGAGAATARAGAGVGGATATSIGAGAAMQGGDVGGDAYDRLMKLDESVWRLNDEYRTLTKHGVKPDRAKQMIAIELSRDTAAAAGIISILAQRVPGGDTIEKVLAGGKVTGNVVGRAARGGVGEALSEGLEEGGGAAAQNLGVAGVDPTQSLTEGVGEAAGMGAVAAGPTGAVAGAASPDQRQAPEVVDDPSVEDMIGEDVAPPADARMDALPNLPPEREPIIIDAEGNAEPAGARAERMQAAENLAQSLERAGRTEEALELRRQMAGYAQETVPQPDPGPRAALPAPGRAEAPPILVDTEGNAESEPARAARLADIEARARAAEAAGRPEDAIALRREAAGYQQEKSAQGIADESRAARLPPEWTDPRLARDFHRVHLQQMADDVAYKQDENGTITGRTPSLNPDWFKGMNETDETKMTVVATRLAVQKALAGERLGVREARVIGAMLDEITGQRQEQVEFVRRELEKARAIRSGAMDPFEDPDMESAGELFQERDYRPDWDGETRAFYELADQARQVDADAVEAILESQADDATVSRRLAEIIHGQQAQSEAQPDAAGGDREAGRGPQDEAASQAPAAQADAPRARDEAVAPAPAAAPAPAPKKAKVGPKGKPLKEPKAAAAPSEKRWAGSQWNDATPAQRRDILREAGYSDVDQNRVLSGTDWSNLTDPVRRAVDASKNAAPATVSAPAEKESAKPTEPTDTARDKNPPAAPETAAESTPATDNTPDKPAFGTENKVFTEDAAERARQRLRSKLGRLNAGIDPEMMQDGITLAGYYIEGGARAFADYSAKMVADLGEEIRPYLRAFYEAVRNWPGFDTEGMTSAADIERGEAQGGDEKAIDAFAERLRGEGFASITDARKLYAEVTGQKAEGATQKRLEELLESAVVRVAREVAASAAPDQAFVELVALYGRQPNLNTRTSTSIEDQAYSTPAPLAFLASRLAGAADGKRVLEPTAGNGMLLLEVDPARAVVNELNPDRAAALRAQGFTVTERNAATEDLVDGKVDVVIQNPPFGIVKDEAGESTQYQTPFSGYKTTEVDHAIVLRTLADMKDDGSAVLIVGGVNKQAKSEDARSDAYNSAAKRRFYYHLYQHYNVVDHFTVAGELYSRQGAAWPVDVIVIRGRGKSARELPAVAVPSVYTDWESLKSLLGNRYESNRLGTNDNGGRAAADRGDGGERAEESRPGSVPEPAGGPDTVSGGRVAKQAGRGDGTAERAVRSGAVPGSRDDTRGRGGEPAGVEQPVRAGTAGERGRPAAEATTAEGSERSENGAQDGAERPPVGAGRVGGSRNEAAVTDSSQVQYQPASKSNAIGTLVPTNMQTAVQDALAALSARAGSPDAFVERELGYKAGTIGDYLSAEQVDALALALGQMKAGKGFIIGDQTGIGKGRVVAGVIRWALQNGKTPIFVTEKPNLYGDMFRDLTDIGVSDVRPVMTNADEKIPLDESGNNVLRSSGSKKHNADLARMAAEASLGDHNMIFTTYSQMQTLKGERTDRMKFLEAFAQGGVVIFDESHNAGGNDASTRNKKDKDASTKEGRAAFARQIAALASGVFYSSATYAKRPSVMDLYFKTDMAIAVEGNITKLPGAIQAGGVPLQQAVAAMLAKAGQYIRRERSFKGVEYDTVVSPVDRRSAEAIATVMRAVQSFDGIKEAAVERLKKEAKREAKLVSMDGSTGGAGAESTNFTAIMHNLIDQMLLALKADQAADMAIEALKRGEKPVITVSNTMGSFIESYVEDAGLVSGDRLGLSFKDLMARYLERSRDVTIKDVSGNKFRRPLTDEELGIHGVSFFKAVKKTIANSPIADTVPISPIDWLHYRLRDAGYSSGEITGRTVTVEYRKDGEAVYRTRSGRETSIAGRRKAISAFNGGTMDAIILNQAGSTGLSLHASEKFKDQRRRTMVIAQAEKNIDTHMQMLGRVHRTGQVVAPRYQQMVADIPAEKRPAAVLAKKMASLNANTTASRSSQFTSKDTVDFLNDYGDEVVAQLMSDMRDVHIKLGSPLAVDKEGFEKEDAARKVTGRIPLLPVKEQEELYDIIEQSYRELVAQKEALGENMLEAKTLELDARTVGRVAMFEGDEGGSPFAQGAMAEIVDVKRLGKPYTVQQVVEIVQKALDRPNDSDIYSLAQYGRQHTETLLNDALAEFAGYRLAQQEQMERDGSKDEAVQGRMTALDGMRDKWTRIMQRLMIGEQYAIHLDEDTVLYGVATSIKRKKGIKNPVAPGGWSVQFAVADGARSITFPLSKVDFEGEPEARLRRTTRDAKGNELMKLFEEGQSESREKRIIITGNLLAGFSKVGRGMVTNYTTADGRVQQGILMPRVFDMESFASEQPVELDPENVARFLNAAPRGIVKTADGILHARNRNGFQLATPRSKSEGGRYYLDADIRAIVGDFTSSGQVMTVDVSRQQLQDVLALVRRKFGQRLLVDAFKKEAEDAGGRAFGKGEKPGKFARLIAEDTTLGPAFDGPEVALFPVGREDGTDKHTYTIIDSAGDGAAVGSLKLGITDGKITRAYAIFLDQDLDAAESARIGRRVLNALRDTIDAPIEIRDIVNPDLLRLLRRAGLYGETDGESTGSRNGYLDPRGQRGPETRYGTEPRARGEAGEGRPQAGAGAARTRGSTPQAVREYLERKLGRKAVAKLIDSGLLSLADSTSAQAPADVRRAARSGQRVFGYFDGRTSWLFTDNLSIDGKAAPGTRDAYGILMHELGVHFGMRQMLGERLFKEVIDAAQNAGGELGEAMARVRRSFARTAAQMHAEGYIVGRPQEDTEAEIREEHVAWLVTDAAALETSLGRRILAKLRAFLVKLGFVRFVSTDTLVELARGAAMKAAGQRLNASEDFVHTAAAEERFAREVESDVEEAIRPAAAAGRRTYKQRARAVIAAIDAKVSPLATLADRADYLKSRYLTLGRIAQSQQTARRIYDTFRGLSEADGQAVYAYLTDTEGTLDAVPPAMRENARRVKAMIEQVGQALVARGVIPPESFEKYQGRYLPRIYLAYLLGDRAVAAVGAGKTLSSQGYAKRRNEDLPQEYRDVVLGEIKDPAYLASKALGVPLRDMAIMTWLAQIAENPAWALPKQVVEWTMPGFDKPRKVTPYWLKSEATRLRERAEFYQGQNRTDALALAAEMDEVADAALREAGISAADMPEGYKQIPNSGRYGALRGLVVKAEIYDDLVGLGRVISADAGIAEKVLGYGGWGTKAVNLWKWSKVAANPPAQVRNVVSNFVLLNLSGVPMHRLPGLIVRAAKEVRTKGRYWQIGQKYGITESSFAAQEMQRIERETLDYLARQKGRFSLAQMAEYFGRFRDWTGDMYQASEMLGKLVKIIDSMEREGKAEADAALAAQEWLFDYSLVGQNTRYLRNAPIGAPFLTFAVKVLPRLLEVAITAPWRFLPYVGLFYAASMVVQSMTGADDDDLEALHKALPEFLQKAGHAMIIPVKDEHGRWQFVDLGYFFPWTYWTDFAHGVGAGAVELVTKGEAGKLGEALTGTGLLGGPIPDLLAAMKTGKDPFTGRDIVREGATTSDAWAAWLAYLWNMAMPTWLAGTVFHDQATSRGAAAHLYEALTGEVDKRGEPRSTVPQALARFAGVNVYGVDPVKSRQKTLLFKKYEISKVKQLRNAIAKDRSLDPDVKKSQVAEYDAKLRRMQADMQKYQRESVVAPELR